MSKVLAPFLGLLAVIVLAFGFFSLYIVPEGRQAVILQFGRVIPPAVTDSGLHFKLPWREARIMEKRILNFDGQPREIPTKGKKYIIVDTTARYRIKDPITFIRQLVDVDRAQQNLKNWIDNATREVVSSHPLVETVRNTNDIIEQSKKNEGRIKKADDDKVQLKSIADTNSLEEIAEEEISGDLETISVGREKLTDKIIKKARALIDPYGLELVDIQLKRVALEESVEHQVYQRMITERQRISEKLRSVGLGRKAQIQGQVKQELQEIESGAYRKVQLIKGEAEAEALQIYAEAFSKDPEFYEFTRTLEAYQKSVREDSRFILSSKAKFLKLLRNGPLEK